jgi:hypothetical protein
VSKGDQVILSPQVDMTEGRKVAIRTPPPTPPK